jgi:hypothetical protein
MNVLQIKYFKIKTGSFSKTVENKMYLYQPGLYQPCSQFQKDVFVIQ